jgi:hypothetical protein
MLNVVESGCRQDCHLPDDEPQPKCINRGHDITVILTKLTLAVLKSDADASPPRSQPDQCPAEGGTEDISGVDLVVEAFYGDDYVDALRPLKPETVL